MKKFNMLAVDQRTSFKEMLKKANKKVSKKLITEVKKEIIEALVKDCGAVLIDPVYCLKLTDLVKKNASLLIALEKSPAKKTKKGIITKLCFSAAKAKKLGADAVKLNLHFNPACNKKILKNQKKIVAKVGNDCKKYKIPFLLEVIVYPLDKKGFKFRKPLFILDAVKEFSKKEYNVKILKLQFPFEISKEGADFCKLITKLAKVPWVLLTAGVDINIFAKQLKIAMKNGCKGFLAGRAVWKDALKIKDKKSRIKWLNTKGLSNLKKINQIVRLKK